MTSGALTEWFPDGVPERLRVRALELVESAGHAGAADAEALVAVAVDATRRLLAEAGTDRAAALDLLAVDALVTHAMELMAENPEEFEARCRDALRALASIPRQP